MHLLKYLAQAGVAARRKAETLIREGDVTVNGRTMTDPTYHVQDADQVMVNGSLVAFESREYYALHKPLGVISTAEDTHGRQTVTELIKTEVRLYPVGRLDADTSGLLLLTNDGNLANHLTHPRYEVPKTYRAELQGAITEAAADKLRQGVELEDGLTAPAEVSLLKRTPNQSEIELTIREGRNRQVRRMAETVGFPVVKLKRIAIGSVKLGDLAVGESRPLSESELERLKRS